jgi:hypothetical protein
VSPGRGRSFRGNRTGRAVLTYFHTRIVRMCGPAIFLLHQTPGAVEKIPMTL